MPAVFGTIAIGMGLAGGIIGGMSEADAADAQHAQAMQQYNMDTFRNQMQGDQVNRQRAQQNAANQFRNMMIARNANQIRTMKEMDLTEQTDIAFANAANAYQVTKSNAESNTVKRGIGKGGTRKAILTMLRSRNSSDIVMLAEHRRRAQGQIESEQKAALANRNFTSQEATVFVPGAAPAHQGSGSQVLMGALGGAQAGLSMASSISQINWGTPNANVDIVGAAGQTGVTSQVGRTTAGGYGVPDIIN